MKKPGEIPQEGETAFRGVRPKRLPPESNWKNVAKAMGFASALIAGGAAALHGVSRHESDRPAPTRLNTPSKPDASQESILREIPAFIRDRIPSIGQAVFEDVLARYTPLRERGHSHRTASEPRSIASLYDQSLYAHLGETQDDLTARINEASMETGMDIMADGDEPSMSGLDQWLEDVRVRKLVRDATIRAGEQALEAAQRARRVDPQRITLLEQMLEVIPSSAPLEGK